MRSGDRERVERYRGSLLGLAAGDAVGTAVEFLPPGTFPPVTGMVGGGAFRLAPGQWTDDTAMALCLAESLVERSGFDPVDQLGRYLRWYRDGYWSSTGECFDIGTGTRRALERFERTGEPWPGDAFPDAAGNGPLMRLAPVALYFAQDPCAAAERSGESARTTHGSRVAADACRYFGALLAAAANGATKEELLAEPHEPAPGYWDAHPLGPETREVALGSFKRRSPPAIRGAGYVVRSLEAALWAFDRGETFREGVLLAANLGEDADTTAAIYGQLAGAFFGEAGIPEEWRRKLVFRDRIGALAERLADAARAQGVSAGPTPGP